jgi:excinuclease UvrABC nuclease subunit
MLTLTIQDILTKSIDDLEALDPDCVGYCIYVIRDAETVLYIGRASDPIQRLMQHFGRSRRSSGASIGSFYQEYKMLSAS